MIEIIDISSDINVKGPKYDRKTEDNSDCDKEFEKQLKHEFMELSLN